VDLAVAATARLGRKLVVVGAGPGVRDVQAPHVDYRGHVSDAELLALMRGARAMIFPAFEDFGMAPVEMMACGRPVVAFAAGGALETVVEGVTGTFAQQQTPQAFAEAIQRLEAMELDPQRIREHAQRFSQERFVETLRDLVLNGYERLQGPHQDGWRIPAPHLLPLE
jgi:glycosyltransferase involved in cell wall biosynthesis